MSRHRRAAPSISAAAPTAPRRRRSAIRGAAWPGAPSTASPATGTLSISRWTHRVARSMPWTGESLSPAAEGSTRNKDGPSGARAGISSALATWAHGTKRFVPDRVQPFDAFSARVVTAAGSQSRSLSRNARVARASPVAIAESQRFFCASVPAASMAAADRTVGQYGPGYAARPSSSSRIAVSTMPSPLPPYASGSARPSHPSWAISFHIDSLSPRGSSHRRRTVAGLQCSSRNARAEFFRSCWSELNEKSMGSGLQAVGANFLRQAEHALSDDVLLDLGRARVDRSRARPEERGREGARLAGRGVDLLELFARDHELAERPEDLECLLVVALLELGVRKLGDRRRGSRRITFLQGGEHPQRRVALHFEVGVDAPHPRADGRVLDQRAAAALELLGGLHQLVERGDVARDAPERVPAALEAQRGLGDRPSLVDVADQVRLVGPRVGHEDFGEERAAGDLLERTQLDAGLAHVEEHARDAAVLGHLRVGAREQDAPVGDRPARGPDLLAVDDEVIALIFGARLEAGQVRSGVRLRVELAPDLLGGQHLLQIPLLLRLGAVHDDRRADEPDAEPVDGGRRAHPGHLVLDDRLLHRRGAPAPVLLGPQHPDVPGLVESPVPRLALVERLQVLFGDVALEPAARRGAEFAVFRRVVQVHRSASAVRAAGRRGAGAPLAEARL